MSKKEIYTELDPINLKNLISQLDNENNTKAIIIKFGATWCGPCKRIKPLCDEMVNNLQDNVIFFDIDIDKNMDLYVALKSKKMINGVPALLAYVKRNDRNYSSWYASDLSISGTDTNNIKNFFSCIKKYNPK